MLYLEKNISGIKLNTNNFITNKPKDLTMINFFNNLNIKNDLNRVYLGPDAFKLLHRNNSAKYGIYSTTDLVKFNLSPFNVNFKNIKSTIFFKQKNLSHYYTQIPPRIDRLNNLFFLSIFYINYSFISEYELDLIDNANFKIVDMLSLQEGNFYFIKNNITQLGIKKPIKLKEELDNCNNEIIDCLIKEKNLFTKLNGNFLKKKNLHYKIGIKNAYDIYAILPFTYDKNWYCNNKECSQINKFLMYTKNHKGFIEIKYYDKVRFPLRILSLLIFFGLILSLSFKYNKSNLN